MYLVQERGRGNDNLFAMKEIIKKHMKSKNQMVFLMRERNVLVHATLKSPFIVDLKCCFRDEEKVYMVFEFMAGGDLYSHLKVSKRFGEARAKFYAAQLVLAIEHLHKLDVIYRYTLVNKGSET